MTSGLPLTLTLTLTLTSCQSPPPAPAPEAIPGPSLRVDRERRLALIPSPDDAPVDKLIAEAQEHARSNPAKVDWWILLGRGWVRKARESTDPGYYLHADACAAVALDLHPGLPLALELRSLVLQNDHKFAQARDVAREVVAARPEDPLAYGALSDALLELGDLDGAARAAQQMVDLKPSLPAYVRASYFRWLTGDLAGAKEIIRLAMGAGADRRDPEPAAFVLVQAAHYFWHEGDYPGAEAGFDLALTRLPDYPPALVGKARVALAQGDGRRAAELLDRAYRRSPLVETAWLLGEARTLAGDARGAAAAHDLVVKQGRRTDPRTLALYWATRDQEHEEALRLAEEERRQRGDVYTLDAYAWAAHRAGKAAEARQAIDAATRHGTRDARLWFHKGAIYLAAGAEAEGKRHLRQALAWNPRFDVIGAAEAARLLAGPGPAATTPH